MNYKKLLKEIDENLSQHLDMEEKNDGKICLLSFSTQNPKLGANVATFSLPAGFTCPGAASCKTFADRTSGKIQTTAGTEIVCYAALQEALRENIRRNRWRNFDYIIEAYNQGGEKAVVHLISQSLVFLLHDQPQVKEIRIHESGDFFAEYYLKAWVEVARNFKRLNFYSYTKSLKYLNSGINEPNNFIITLSKDGKYDNLLGGLDYKEVEVYNTPEELLAAGKMLDIDDSLSKVKGGKSKNFGLLLHGNVRAGEREKERMKDDPEEIKRWDDMRKNTYRNRIFIKYWKERNKWKPINSGRVITYKQASPENIERVKNIINKLENNNDKKGVSYYKKLKSYLNAVKMYHDKYKFNENKDLIKIIPRKYR